MFKLKVIDYASQYSNRAAAQINRIDEKRVCKWKKQREELENLLAKKKHLDSVGCKAALLDITEVLILWIWSESRKLKHCLQCYPTESSWACSRARQRRVSSQQRVVAQVHQASPPIGATEDHSQPETADRSHTLSGQFRHQDAETALTYVTHSYFVLSLLIPHCHSNRLVMVGYIYNICVIIWWVHGYRHERLIGCPIAMDNGE